jgi:hypothetical protein
LIPSGWAWWLSLRTNVSAGIGRCLDALFAGTTPNELAVVGVCKAAPTRRLRRPGRPAIPCA